MLPTLGKHHEKEKWKPSIVLHIGDRYIYLKLKVKIRKRPQADIVRQIRTLCVILKLRTRRLRNQTWRTITNIQTNAVQPSPPTVPTNRRNLVFLLRPSCTLP